MKHIAKRALVVFAVLMSLAMSGSAVAAAPEPSSAAPTQLFTGGGSGQTRPNVGDLPFFGSYSSNGQLGSGRVDFHVGIPGNPARFTRSDGMTLTGTATFSDECGPVKLSPPLECVSADLSGTSDIAHAHLALVVVLPAFDGSDGSFLMSGTLTLRHRLGYVMADTNGTTYAFGGIDHLGDARSSRVVDVERTPSGSGYWIVNAIGNVFAFGDARYFGNANASALSPGEVVTSISATPTAKGYWLFTSKGRAFTFGNAKTFGDLHALRLNGPIVGSVATPTGNGYYMVGSDGGVFAFGDAKFRGSMGDTRLNQPVVGLVPTADNSGYWLVASDGGVFAFNAHFYGSMGDTPLNQPIRAMVPYGTAYLMVASDGGVFNFSHAPFFGSKGATPMPAPIVSGTATG